jgi:two-component system, response regulator YesN
MAKSIVIVDDEKLVIYGICSLLAENDINYEVGATFNSGEEGLRFCMSNPPDLLLTDIGMPGMSGLELIEKIRQTNTEMKIVVLSCHDEYDMVHRAFVLGADDYILKKDIEKDSLYQILEKLLPADSGEEYTHDKSDKLSHLSDINDFIPDNAGSLGIIGFKSEYHNENAEVFWQPDIPMLHQLIKDDILPYGKFYLGLRNDLVIFFPDLDTRCEGKIDKLLEKTRLSISKYINRPVFISRYIMGKQESITSAYLKGVKILDGLFYCEKSSILTTVTKSPSWKFPLTFSISESCLDQGWSSDIEDFFNLAVEQWIDPEAVKAELTFAVKHLLHHIREIRESDFSVAMGDDSTPYYHKISHFSDLLQLKSWIHNLLTRISENLKSGRQSSSAVNKTKLCISENLLQDLRLSVVADMLGINANHLSTIFKKETGESYTDYVNGLRVARACELLESTDFSAKEIASRCGYLNPNYFSRVFKKITKLTVSDYRSGRKQ